jgi:hypothetical protein
LSIGEQNIVELDTYNQGEYPYGKRPTKEETYKLQIAYFLSQCKKKEYQTKCSAQATRSITS